jgi:hypothetical protein
MLPAEVIVPNELDNALVATSRSGSSYSAVEHLRDQLDSAAGADRD